MTSSLHPNRHQGDDSFHSTTSEAFPRQAAESPVAALARIAAAIAIGAPLITFAGLAREALASGATAEQVVGTLLAVGPVVGSARVVAATAPLAAELGYDIDRGLETLE